MVQTCWARAPPCPRSGRRRLAVFSWRYAEQASEQTRHMALVREAAAGRDDFERNAHPSQLSFCALDPLARDVRMRGAAELGAEFAREMKHAELHDAREFRQG